MPDPPHKLTPWPGATVPHLQVGRGKDPLQTALSLADAGSSAMKRPETASCAEARGRNLAVEAFFRYWPCRTRVSCHYLVWAA